MADAVENVTQIDEGNRVVKMLTSTSDGTGESAVTKVDVSALQGAPAAVAITRIKAVTAGMGFKLLWDATTDEIAVEVPAGVDVDLEFNPPLRNSNATGATGDILLTTIGHTSGDTYTCQLEMVKTPLS